MSTTKNPHFDKKFIEAQRTLLLGIKEQILNNLSEKSKEDLHIDSDEVIEEGDQAQTYLNQNLSFGLRERDLFKLREIEAALIRIDDGTYGLCEELEEPISKKRLQKVPWARLSIEAAEQLERDQQQYQKIG